MARSPLHLELPAVPESIAELRRAISAFAYRAGANRAVVADIALAVSEAATNVVVHAYRSAPGTLEVDADARSGMLTVRVLDAGVGMAPRADSPGLGLGLPLIARLADRFEVGLGPTGTGTELAMTFGLEASRVRAG